MNPVPHAPGDFVGRLCAALLRNSGDVIVTDSNGSDTGSQLMSRILWAGNWLTGALGAGPGTVVAVTSANTTWGLVLRYAAHVVGATTCHLPFIGAERQQALLDLVTPTVTVTDGTGPMAEAGSWSVQTMPQPGGSLPKPDAERFAAIRRYRDDDACLLIASGGTTGIPKASYRTSARYTAMLDLPANAARRQLVVTPLAYISATLVDETLIGGGSVVLGEHSWPIEAVVETIHSEAATHMFVVEPALADLVAAAADPRTRRMLGSLQQVFHLGSSAPVGLRARAHELLGDVVTHGYAASELGPVTSTAGHPFDPATAGYVVPAAQCRIVDDGGTPVGPGEVGAILVKSPWTANGYWRTGPTAEFGDWFDTKDQGKLSAAGELTVIGRRGDQLGTAGVHASELEGVTSLAAGVEYVVVLPAGDGAALVIVQSHDPNVRQGVDGALAPFRDRVETKVVVLERIPRTEQGKPDRLTLAQLATPRG